MTCAPFGLESQRCNRGCPMTFKESVRLNLTARYFFDFRGRASRSEFWWFMLFIGLVNMAVSLLIVILPPILAGTFSLIVSLLLLPPNLGLTVRRFHDRNLRGWWLLLPMLALGGWMVTGGVSTPSLPGNLLSLAMCLAYLAILCLPGQPWTNRFGPPPVLSPI